MASEEPCNCPACWRERNPTADADTAPEAILITYHEDDARPWRISIPRIGAFSFETKESVTAALAALDDLDAPDA